MQHTLGCHYTIVEFEDLLKIKNMDTALSSTNIELTKITKTGQQQYNAIVGQKSWSIIFLCLNMESSCMMKIAINCYWQPLFCQIDKIMSRLVEITFFFNIFTLATNKIMRVIIYVINKCQNSDLLVPFFYITNLYHISMAVKLFLISILVINYNQSNK